MVAHDLYGQGAVSGLEESWWSWLSGCLEYFSLIDKNSENMK
jgi:hypothetical protein